ncbi:MAG: hypothetical protein EOM83_04340 [Clostridia bacterium]|nr:hypothetical protein [Clostridia bacterium]
MSIRKKLISATHRRVHRIAWRLLMFGLLLLITKPSASQENEQLWIGIRSGVSLPLGAYKNSPDEMGGFARAGFSVIAETAWFFSKHLGAGISASYNLHTVDVAALGRFRMNKDPFLSNIIIRSDPYLIITAMPGIYFRYPISTKFTATANLHVGLLYGRTPYQLFKPDYYLLPDTWQEKTSAQDYKFSWMAGVAVQYQATPCIGLVVAADVCADQLQFNFVTGSGERTDKLKMAFVNLSAGFRLSIF